MAKRQATVFGGQCRRSAGYSEDRKRGIASFNLGVWILGCDVACEMGEISNSKIEQVTRS